MYDQVVTKYMYGGSFVFVFNEKNYCTCRTSRTCIYICNVHRVICEMHVYTCRYKEGFYMYISCSFPFNLCSLSSLIGIAQNLPLHIT